jgi:GH15 family glucan-1,4-alpha-glucosidase
VDVVQESSPELWVVLFLREKELRSPDDGLLKRYQDDAQEGAFLCCSFWLVECLANQGRVDEAQAVFERTLSTSNDLGLFSEEFDTTSSEMLGNFPQGLTHLSHIAAAHALAAHQAPV